jgi:hypothetical protein
MKFRTVMVTATAAAAALSFAAAGSAAAQTLGHPVQRMSASASQVNGSRLAKGLLPGSAYGADFTPNGSANTGGKLVSTRVRQTPGSLSCGTFADLVYDSGWGNTAGAYALYYNQDEASGWPSTQYSVGEDVSQFATDQAASTYFNEAYAKYAACRSFVVPNPSDNSPGGGATDVSDTTTSKTTVSGHQAFAGSELWTPSEGTAKYSAYYVEVLYAVSGTNVYYMWEIIGAVDEVSPGLMSDLIHRVQSL